MTDAITYEWTGAPNASPSMKRVNGVVTRTNMVTNPNFESGTVLPFKSNTGAPTLTAATSPARSGAYSLKATSTVAVGDVAVLLALNVPAAGRYTVSYWVYSAVACTSFFDNDANGSVGITAVQPSTWTRVQAVVSFPAGAWTLYFHNTRSSTAAGQVVYFDDFLIEAGATDGSYFDGNSRVGTTYAWNGTPNASSSVQRVDGGVTRTNLASDPTGAGGAYWNISGGNAATYTQDTTSWPQSHTQGRTARRLHITAADANSQAGAKVPNAEIVLGAGDSLTVSFWTYWATQRTGTTLRGNVYADAQDPDNASSYKGLAFAGYDLPPNVWTFVKATGTANGPMRIPAGNGVGAYGIKALTGEDLYFTEFILERGTTVGSFFDGSSPWDLYAWADRTSTSTSTSAAAGVPEFTPAITTSNTSTSTAAVDFEFHQIVSTLSQSDSAAWGSKPAFLSTDYDSVGPFWVGDSPLTAWAIEVDSETNLFGVFDRGEVSILDPAGQVVVVQPSPFLDERTLVVTVPVGTFSTPGVYRFVPRLIGRGSVTLPSVPVVIQQDDGWHSLESARAGWPEASTEDERVYRLLHTARIQCEQFAPDYAGRAPETYRQAQLLQARALWASGAVSQGDQFGDGAGLSVTVFPMDWTVKNLLRPKRGVGAMF